ncbi:MAG: acyl-CoA desaturase [Calditrichaeota bacterium]|nr:MAG: acyl-CoA desaturase [Calditrichota bacterium]
MVTQQEVEKINWRESIPFFLIHLACGLVIWAGFSWIALAVLVLTYSARMFAITAGYHRYFSHRTFKTSRWFQFVLAFMGTAALQKGPLWWSAHHRHHHRHSDQEEDIHSPRQKGFWWAHVGWILCDKYKCAHLKLVHDLQKFPELRFLDRWHMLPGILLAVVLFATGAGLNHAFPSLHTSGFQLLVWGFFISTTLLYHGTFTVNSLTHVFGRRRFATTDDSRNSFLISLFTLGEGWHNNHHRFPSSERQGFYWWELDLSHYMLRLLSWVGLVWDLREPPRKVYAEGSKLRKPNRAFLAKQFERQPQS